MPMRCSHNAVQLGHVGDTDMRAGTVAGLRNSICMRAPCIAFRVCNECIHFISRFHDLTFGHARTGAIIYGRTAVRHLATHFFIS